MRTLAILVMFIGLCLFVGCAALSAEQQAQLDRLETEIGKSIEEAQKIYDLQADVRQRWKDGKLTADEAIKLLDDLTQRGQAVAERITALKTEYEGAKKQGIPWYMIAWGVISTAASIFLKGALNDVIAGVEKAGNKDTKSAIAGMGNWLVNFFVKRRTPAKSTNVS